jgi:protein SCO1
MRARVVLLSLLALTGPGVSAAPETSWPSDSIYQLEAELRSQDGKSHGLDLYAGHAVLVTMFYGTCPATCPLIIDTLRAIEQATPPAQRSSLRVLMISIDPQRDSAASLETLAKTRRIDPARWTLARTDAANVRDIAAVLNIQYRKLPNGEYNHSTVITVLSPKGEIVRQSSVIGRADASLLAALSGA